MLRETVTAGDSLMEKVIVPWLSSKWSQRSGGGGGSGRRTSSRTSHQLPGRKWMRNAAHMTRQRVRLGVNSGEKWSYLVKDVVTNAWLVIHGLWTDQLSSKTLVISRSLTCVTRVLLSDLPFGNTKKKKEMQHDLFIFLIWSTYRI